MPDPYEIRVKPLTARYLDKDDVPDYDPDMFYIQDGDGNVVSQWGGSYMSTPKWYHLTGTNEEIRLECELDRMDEMRHKKLLDSQLAELDELDKSIRNGNDQLAESKAVEARKAIEKSRKSAGTELEVRPDVPYSPFKNYVRPKNSPNAIVEIPIETDTGMIMPPLPEHVCELPEAVETETKGWNSYDSKPVDSVVIPHNTVFECICGQAWFVIVRKVPFHAAKRKNQHSFGWHKIRWYHFGRKADLKRRQEQK